VLLAAVGRVEIVMTFVNTDQQSLARLEGGLSKWNASSLTCCAELEAEADTRHRSLR